MYWPAVGMTILTFVCAGVVAGFVIFVITIVENTALSLTIIFGTFFIALSIFFGLTLGPSDMPF